MKQEKRKSARNHIHYLISKYSELKRNAEALATMFEKELDILKASTFPDQIKIFEKRARVETWAQKVIMYEMFINDLRKG